MHQIKAFEKEDAKALLVSSGLLLTILCAAAAISSAFSRCQLEPVPVGKQGMSFRHDPSRVNM